MTDAATDTDLASFEQTLETGEPIDIRFPGGERLYVDRPLPFLCVYRVPADQRSPVAERLVTTQASYLVAPTQQPVDEDSGPLDVVDRLAARMSDRFGGFLIIEVWARSRDREDRDPYDLQPSFQVHAPDGEPLEPTVTALSKALQSVRIHHFVPHVTICCTDRPAPSDLPTLHLPRLHGSSDSSTFTIGVEVDPVFEDHETGDFYPILFDSLRRQLSDALRRGFHAFAASRTSFEAPAHVALGRRLLERAVTEVDRGLSDIDESFDFLLQTTPVNADDAWADFKESNFEINPVFRYRPLGIDPELLKRRLYSLPVEQVEDPSLSWIFREKQEELDRKITMLRDRDSRQFFFESLQLYGEVDRGLLEEARGLLERLPPEDYDLGSTEHLDAEAFSEVAGAEFTHYRHTYADFPETVHIRRDMPPGLMVSRGRLLIGYRTRIPAPRVDALLHHEVGTHMLTYFNGCEQPLRLLYNGLAGYEALQEGIAVLAEHLVGGLSVPRLRVLAARVLAAHCMIEGATFVELYRLLRGDHGFEEHEAFSISMRMFRGGGLIKDVIYLRGLHALMHYLADGGTMDPLFVGKIALHHLPVLEELHFRGVLKSPPLSPRYLLDEAARDRLERIRQGGGLLDLIEY